jgi:hypothetical protein
VTKFLYIVFCGFTLLGRGGTALAVGDPPKGLDTANAVLHAAMLTGAMAFRCAWTTNDTNAWRKQIGQISTMGLEGLVSEGKITLDDAREAQAFQLQTAGVDLVLRVADKNKQLGKCSDAKKQSDWNLMVNLTPPSGAELVSIPETSQMHFAQVASSQCVLQAIILLDDRTSGADVVAQAVIRECTEEAERVFYLTQLAQAHQPDQAQRFADDVVRSDTWSKETASQVLQFRAHVSEADLASSAVAR